MAKEPSWEEGGDTGVTASPSPGAPEVIPHSSQLETHHDDEESKGDELDELGARPGEPIGRYLVLQEVGRGAMGVVYAAYDPELDRRVAIKVLGHRGGVADISRLRQTREAKALARLSHPYVITIHDVGQWRGRLFLAMEFVDGSTLREWSDQKGRTSDEVLEALVQAGRGLVAAHEAGLVHRDFKPDNVLVSKGGKVAVTDFGTARGFGEVDEPSDSSVSDSADAVLVSSTLTQTGALVGTPLYMAPEQLVGKRATAASDQYAFCVTAYRCLTGRVPYDASTVAELWAQVREGLDAAEFDELPVSPRIRRALRRGLERNPSDRWPSLDALLEQLESQPVASRVGWWVGGGAVLGAVALAVAATRPSEADESSACSGAAQQLEGVWDQTRRQDVADALRRTGVPYADVSVSFVHKTLDEYATAWSREYQDNCEATRVRGEQSQETMELRSACLWRAKTELAARVEVLREADKDVAERILEVATTLPAPSQCADVAVLRTELIPPEDASLREAVQDKRADLARLNAMVDLGRYEEAWEGLDDLVQDPAAQRYPPLQVEALIGRGRASTLLGEFDSAEAELRRALSLSLEKSAYRLASTAAARLAFTVGFEMDRIDEGRSLAEVALGLAQSGGWQPEEVKARQAFALLTMNRGQVEQAEDEARAALRLSRTVYGPDGNATLDVQIVLADALRRQGKYEEAVELTRDVLASRERLLGARHPQCAQARYNLGTMIGFRGHYSEAEEQMQTALEIQEEALGPMHPDTISTRAGVAVSMAAQQKFDEAWDMLLETRNQLEAQPGVARALLGRVHQNLGEVAWRMGRPEEARLEYQKALTVLEDTLGPKNPELSHILRAIAELEVRQGLLAEARSNYQRTWEIVRHGGVPVGTQMETAYALARVEWELGMRGQARERVAAALELGKAHPDQKTPIDELRVWLQEHAEGENP